MSDVEPITPATPAQSFPPGWYMDGNGRRERWWDGAAWVNQYRPLQSVAAPGVVVVQGKRTNHAFHLIMTLVTVGLWLPVWIIVAIANA